MYYKAGVFANSDCTASENKRICDFQRHKKGCELQPFLIIFLGITNC